MMHKDFLAGKELDKQLKMMFGPQLFCPRLNQRKKKPVMQQYLLPFNGLKLLSYN